MLSLLCHNYPNFSIHFSVIKRYISNNHYDVLKLPRNCSRKDIRNAFLKLSKECHPDRNINKDSHATYVQIVEAYKVLSKPHSRTLYDLGLSNPDYNNVNVRYAQPGTGAYAGSFWESRDKSQDQFYEAKPYYGIKGIKKIPNGLIVLFCLAFVSFGVSLQILAIRHSFTLKREDMERKSAEIEKLHAQIRSRALENGDKKQLELLKHNLGHNN